MYLGINRGFYLQRELLSRGMFSYLQSLTGSMQFNVAHVDQGCPLPVSVDVSLSIGFVAMAPSKLHAYDWRTFWVLIKQKVSALNLALTSECSLQTTVG